MRRHAVAALLRYRLGTEVDGGRKNKGSAPVMEKLTPLMAVAYEGFVTIALWAAQASLGGGNDGCDHRRVAQLGVGGCSCAV